MRFLFCFILSIFILSSCKTSKKSIDASSSIMEPLVISMKKTACYGTCPVSDLQIYGDLTVNLKAERHLDKIGNFQASISEQRFEEIKTMFRAAEFFSLEDKYSESITDLPTTYVHFADSGKEKRIMDYYGAPKALKELESELSLLLEELTWIKIDD